MIRSLFLRSFQTSKSSAFKLNTITQTKSQIFSQSLFNSFLFRAYISHDKKSFNLEKFIVEPTETHTSTCFFLTGYDSDPEKYTSTAKVIQEAGLGHMKFIIIRPPLKEHELLGKTQFPFWYEFAQSADLDEAEDLQFVFEHIQNIIIEETVMTDIHPTRSAILGIHQGAVAGFWTTYQGDFEVAASICIDAEFPESVMDFIRMEEPIPLIKDPRRHIPCLLLKSESSKEVDFRETYSHIVEAIEGRLDEVYSQYFPLNPDADPSYYLKFVKDCSAFLTAKIPQKIRPLDEHQVEEWEGLKKLTKLTELMKTSPQVEKEDIDKFGEDIIKDDKGPPLSQEEIDLAEKKIDKFNEKVKEDITIEEENREIEYQQFLKENMSTQQYKDFTEAKKIAIQELADTNEKLELYDLKLKKLHKLLELKERLEGTPTEIDPDDSDYGEADEFFTAKDLPIINQEIEQLRDYFEVTPEALKNEEEIISTFNKLSDFDISSKRGSKK